MQSYIVYIGLLLFSFAFARIAERTQKLKYVIIVAIVMSVIAGTRDYTVGLDTEGYINAINNICSGNLNYAFGLEWSFRYICYTLSFVFNDAQVYLFIFALITNILIILRFWDLKEHISVSWAIAGYYIMFYMVSLNLMRQFVAIAIVFYATKYLMSKKQGIFIILVVCASLFHKSALISLFYVFINMTSWNTLSKRQKLVAVVFIVLSPIIVYYVFENLKQYTVYFDVINVNIGIMIVIKVIVLFLVWITWNNTEIYSISLEKKIKIKGIQRNIMMSYFVGLVISGLGYIWKFVSRIGLYFYIFESVYIGMLFKQKNTRNNFLLKLAIIGILVYQLCANLIGNGQGQHPYLFFWQ